MKLIFLYFCLFASFHSYGKNRLDAPNPTPEVASLGVVIVNIFELDMSGNSFYADFYLWCRWKGTIDPLKNIEFSNSKEQWSFSKTNLHDSSILLKDSFCYNSVHIQGKFNHNFILNNYPFDKQKISVQLENSIYTSEQLVYAADTANSNMENNITIPGWNIEKFEFNNSQHKYQSNFGLPENKDNDSYNNLSFSITLHRPAGYFFWKLLLPIIIVLLSSLGSIIIYPKYVDARIYAPVGALLTTVFLQQSYSSQLPDISYLILTDKIYVVVYIAILAGILHAIYTANLIKDGSEESIKRAISLDKAYIIVVSVLLLVSSIVFIV